MKNIFKKTVATLLITVTMATSAVANIPIRQTFEAGGATVNWYGDEARITILAEGDVLDLFLNSTRAVVNGNEIILPDFIFVEGGTSFLTEASLLAILDALILEVLDEEVETIEDNQSVQAVQDSRPTGFLHRIEHAGNTAYLFGTLHAGPSYMFPLHDMVYEAMLRSDIFATEVSLSGEEYTEEDWMQLEAAILLPDDLTIADILSEEAYEWYVYATQTYGLRYQEFYRLSPTFIQFDLMRRAMAYAENVDFSGANSSVDLYVVEHALERELPIIGLVTNAQQMTHLSQAPLEVFEVVAATFPTFEAAVEEFSNVALTTEFAASYIANYISGLNAWALEEGSHGHEALIRHNAETLLNTRSREFAHEIIRLLESFEEDEVLFIAIGVSHVIRYGNILGIELQNVVDFLREEGVVVEALFN